MGKFFEKVSIPEVGENKEEKREKRKVDGKVLFWALAVFAFAFLPRLIALFKVVAPESPGWYDDTFHHWQIAYLSQTVGFKQSFLRLWDLKGMEYFWGLLHPLSLVGLFKLTGSTSILVPRFLSLFSGCLAIVFLFFLLWRYFNLGAALGSVVWISLMPVMIYADTAGLQEPLALALIFGALLFWPKGPVLTGLLISLAGMIRAEYWLFGTGLFAASFFAKEKSDHKVLLGVGWLIPTLLYVKYLLDHTGNAIYPIYWNFLASVKGEWFADVPLPPGGLETQYIARVIFTFGVIGALLVFFKKIRPYFLFLFGFSNILFIGFMLGFGAYIKGYLPRFWLDRLFAWPYSFGGILIAVFFLSWLPRKFRAPALAKIFGWLIILVGLAISQLTWLPIERLAEASQHRYLAEKEFAEKTADFYQGGTILIPEDRPPFVYYLVHDYGISGERLLGQMFDPFYYFEEDPFSDWSEYRLRIIDWLAKSDVRLIVVYTERERYQNLIKKEPGIFSYLGVIGPGIEVYGVKPS